MKEVTVRQERRRGPRIEKDIPLKLRIGEYDIVTSTSNLSSVGAYCCVGRYLEPLTKLKIMLLLPQPKDNKKVATRKVECEGVVVRIEGPFDNPPQYNVAIFFSDIDKAEAKKISEFVNHHLSIE
ncbi:PilZ domain-containing protein [Candidatus Omnitrophota bacterium]